MEASFGAHLLFSPPGDVSVFGHDFCPTGGERARRPTHWAHLLNHVASRFVLDFLGCSVDDVVYFLTLVGGGSQYSLGKGERVLSLNICLLIPLRWLRATFGMPIIVIALRKRCVCAFCGGLMLGL